MSRLCISLVIILLMCSATTFSLESTVSYSGSTFVTYDRKNAHSLLDPENRYIAADNYQYHSYFNALGGWSYQEVLATQFSLQSLYDESKKEKLSIRIKEGYVSFNLGSRWELEVGRKISDWGCGYYKRPSSILDPVRTTTDIQDRASRFVGNDIVQLNWFSDQLSISMVAANTLDAFRVGKTISAVKINTLLDGWDVSVIGSYDEENTFRLGLNTTKVFGKALECHGEILYGRQRDRLYARPDGWAVLKEDHYLRGIVGFLYSINWGGRDVRWIAEVYYNGLGYSPAEWRNYKQMVDNMIVNMNTPNASERALAASAYKSLTANYDVDALSRTVVFSTIDNLPPIFSLLSMTPIILFSPEDLGIIAILNAQLHLSKGVNVFIDATSFRGKTESVYQSIPYRYQLSVGIRFAL